MQVFMPYPDPHQSVCTLDPSRLGNQIYREAKTLITGGWPNHPAAKIWSPHHHALAEYALLGLEELTRRGRHYERWYQFFGEIYRSTPATGLPPIIGYEPFHAGHRAALLAKGEQDLIWQQFCKKLYSTCTTEFPARTLDQKLHVPAKRKYWTPTDYAKANAHLQVDPASSWYSQFNWAETPEPDTKKAYIWKLP